MASVQQITYQMIMDYLSPNKVVKNELGISSFPTKENIVINVSDFPKKIKRFFNKNFFRYGVLTYDDDHNNISLYTSMLTCLDSSFLTMNKDNKISYINAFKRKVKNDFYNKKLFKKFKYSECGVSEKILMSEMSDKVSMMVIQALVDYLSINLIIFNFDDQKRYLIHSREAYNVYYPTVILGFSNDYYEPIFTNKKKSYTYNDKIIKKILKNEIKKMTFNGLEDFSTNKDVNSIIQDIVEMNKSSFDTINSEDNDIDILSVTVDDDESEDDDESDDDNKSTSSFESETQDSVSEAQKSIEESQNLESVSEVLESDSDEYEVDSDDDLSNESIKLKDNKINNHYKKYKEFSKSKWNKMRKDELLDVINNLKLNVGKYQNKKKSEVIKDIIQTISSQ
jgi:hypothetical protein